VESGRDRELEQVHVLVEASVDLIARCLPGIVERRRGAVTNMSSSAGFQPLPYNAAYAAARGYLLLLSEAVHAEVEEYAVTVTVVCPGPVPSGFEQASDAGYFADRLPMMAFVSAERAAREGLAAADKGRISVIPGGPQVRAALAPNRKFPSWLVLPISKRMMARR
jgi:hypothetical protein